MRKVTYGAACSLDGFITARDGGMDWLHFSRDVQEVMASYWQNVDTILMGRKTWAGAVASQEGGTGEEGSGDPGGGIPDVRVLAHADLACSLFEAGVIDEVGLNIHPVLLGSGTPMFGDPGWRIGLHLLENRAIDGGCVLATYRVTG